MPCDPRQDFRRTSSSPIPSQAATRWITRRFALPLAILLGTVWCTAALAAQASADSSGQQPQSVSPRWWAIECGKYESLVIQHPDSYLRYRMHTVDEKGDRVREEIETPQGSVARLILRDGHPLTGEEDEAERARLKELLDSPSTFERHIKSEQSNKKMGVDLLKLMPDAMLWSYAPGQPSDPGAAPDHAADRLIVLEFEPNPKWSPPDIPSEALTGLAGRIWVDMRSHRLVRLEARVVRPVNVGWGVVAHLYPGGTVSLQQTQVGGERWIADHVIEQLAVRALMVKTIHQHLVYDTSDYSPVPPMTYQQAIKLLLDAPLPTH